MSGQGEWFQKPHFQPADSTTCLWHEKKEKTEHPLLKERLGPKPFIPPTACPRGSGRESTERDREGQRDGTFQTPPCTEAGSQKVAFRRDSTDLFLASSCREDGFPHKGEKQKRRLPHREDLTAEQESVSPAVTDKGLRHPASDPGEGLPDPSSR